MSHFECRLNRRFWRSKKVVQVVQIGGTVSFDFVSGKSMLDLMQKVAKVRKGKESFSKDA